MQNKKCRLCGNENLKLSRKTNINYDLKGLDFAISDSRYGRTLDIYSCPDCGLLQSFVDGDVLHFYQEMADEGYENIRKERLLQAKNILLYIADLKPDLGRLLDVGAGSGILVEEALGFGCEPVGIEPSIWLYEKARSLSLPVLLGTLDNKEIDCDYDVVTIIDVIEHVDDPVGLLCEAKKRLSTDGVICITTPDVSSFFARILGWRWWHFRVAHISYFNKKNLRLLCDRAGLEIISIKRPSWFFSYEYLVSRLENYIPLASYFKFSFLRNITIPLNLFFRFANNQIRIK